MRIPSSPLPFLSAIESSTTFSTFTDDRKASSSPGPFRSPPCMRAQTYKKYSSLMVFQVPSLLSERPRTSENQFKMYSARVLSILGIYTGPTTHQTSNKIHTCAWRSPTLYLSSDLSFQFQMNKNGRVICEFETMKFMESFVCWRANLTNDNISSAYARSENGYGF